MLQFFIGLFVGGIIGFAICAICSITGAKDNAELPLNKETGDENVRSK